MTHSEVIDFINTHCRRKDGYFKRMSPSFLSLNSDKFEYIQRYTHFLPDDATFPQRAWHIINQVDNAKMCANCGVKPLKWSLVSYKYPEFCCNSCAGLSDQIKAKKREDSIAKWGVPHHTQAQDVKDKHRTTLMERYGVPSFSQTAEYKEKTKATHMARYGYDNPLANPEFKAKFIATNREKYGADYALQTDAIKLKQRETNLEKYGVVSPTQVPEIKAKQEATLMERFGVINPKHRHFTKGQLEILSDPKRLSELCDDNAIHIVAEHLDVDVTTVYNYLHRHDLQDKYIQSSASNVEIMVANYVADLGVNVVRNTRAVISPLELDIYLPDQRVAIEVNGVYFHREGMGRGRDYHWGKWKSCADQGIRLFSYFDDEIYRSWRVIKSKLAYLVGKHSDTKLGARQCEIAELTDFNTESDFLNENHIQGSINYRTRTLAAYHKGQVVGIMCFKEVAGGVEIVRFSTDVDYIIPGLFSKFVSHYVKCYNFIGTIHSFSDNCHSDGNLYRQAGFIIHSRVAPGYSYTHGGRPRENRQRFMKNKIAKRFGISTEGKTEWQLMQELGYDRVWDCGKIKWVKEIR